MPPRCCPTYVVAIICKITNGLGNQMFQYAMGRTLADWLDDSLYLDDSWYKNKDYPVYLKQFPVRGEWRLPNHNRNIIKMEGWWEQNKFVDKFDINVLRNDLHSPLQSSMLKEVADGDSVGIHVRRKHLSHLHKILPVNYYEAAYKQMKNWMPHCRFYVFSDDLNWSRTNLKFPATFVSRPDLEDWTLLAACKHHIIANSTFSWWAARLGNGRVIYPAEWYANGVPASFIPSAWTEKGWVL